MSLPSDIAKRRIKMIYLHYNIRFSAKGKHKGENS